MKPTKHYSNIQERRVSETLNWRVVSGSGAVACAPGDIQSDRWLGECKTHVSAGSDIIFKKDVWDKICQEARFRYKYPILIVDDGSQSIDCTWCLFFSHSVNLNDIVVEPLNITIRTNIKFSGQDLLRRYRKAKQGVADSKYLAFTALWRDSEVMLMLLRYFVPLGGE